MNWTLEVVVVPVSDVDRSKAFYADQLGFDVDHDTVIGDDVRIVQLTPPGSGCSVVIGKGDGFAWSENLKLADAGDQVRKTHLELLAAKAAGGK